MATDIRRCQSSERALSQYVSSVCCEARLHGAQGTGAARRPRHAPAGAGAAGLRAWCAGICASAGGAEWCSALGAARRGVAQLGRGGRAPRGRLCVCRRLLLGPCAGMTPGEKGYAALSDRQLDFMNAEVSLCILRVPAQQASTYAWRRHACCDVRAWAASLGKACTCAAAVRGHTPA